MDFFAQQDEARRRSRWLVAWYAAALLFAVASYCLAAALGYYVLAKFTGALPLPVPLKVYLWVGGTVGGFILAVSAYRMWQLGDGGPAVAELLGARYVEPGKCTPPERRLVNVVEEVSVGRI